MVDDQQQAARFQRTRQLVEHGGHVDLRPAAFFRIDPVQIVIDLDHDDGVERRILQAHVRGIDGDVLDVLQVLPGDAILPGVLHELVVGRVVEQQHVALRTDHVAQQLAVVAIGGEEVEHLHARPDARETQHGGGPIGDVALQIVGTSAGVRDGGIVDVRGRRGATNPQVGDE